MPSTLTRQTPVIGPGFGTAAAEVAVPKPLPACIDSVPDVSSAHLMAETHTADLSNLDTDALRKRLVQLGRYL